MFTLIFKGNCQFNMTHAQAVAACGDHPIIEGTETLGGQHMVGIRTEHGAFDLVTTSNSEFLALLDDIRPERDPASDPYM